MIYTKKGDLGNSSVINGLPKPKDAPVFKILGDIDELSANLGVAKSEAMSTVKDTITLLQKQFIELSGFIAGGAEFDFLKAVSDFETLIDTFESKLKPRHDFILSGDTVTGARIDVARTVARRVEREAVTAVRTFSLKKEVLPYFNRLSDLLFVLARYADMLCYDKQAEVKADVSLTAANTSKKFNADSAMRLCQKVAVKAREQGIKVVCSVCNSEGNQMAFLRDDGAFVASIDIAQNKARTAAALQMSTKQALEYTKDKDSLFGLQYINDPKMVLLPGGELLKVNGEPVGAFGVSGGMGWQDEELGIYGRNLFERGDF